MRYFYIILLTFLVSCVQDPMAPEQSINFDPASEGAYVLCEGVWGQGNSSLARYDLEKDLFIQDYYQISNNGMTLGDLANDIVLYGDTAFITITTAGVIEAIDVKEGTSIGRIELPENSAPREISIINDTIAVVSDLYLDILHVFNPQLLEIEEIIINTGPAPEAVVSHNDIIFTANSGYGYYRKDEPKAGTISVIDFSSGNEIILLENVQNAVELIANKKENRLYCCYYHVTAEVDSIGGIVEYDLKTFEEKRRWEIDALSITLSSTGDSLLFIAYNDIYFIDLRNNKSPEVFIKNPEPSGIWYDISVSPFDNNIWVCNAKNHQIDGEVMIFDLSYNGELLRKFKTGVNPAKIVFF